MNIFIAVHHFPPQYTGGAELRALRTAACLLDRGHTVHVLSIERIDDSSVEGLAWDDEHYEGVPIRRLRFNGASTPDWFVYSYNNRWIGEHLKQYLAEIKPDLFHVFGGYLLSGSVIHTAVDLGIPTFLSLTDYWFLCPSIQLVDSRSRIYDDYLDPANGLQSYYEQKRRYRYLGRLFPALMRTYWRSNKRGIEMFRKRQKYLIDTLNRVDMIITPSRFIGGLHIRAGVSPDRVTYLRQGRTFPNLTPDLLVKQPSETMRLAYMGQLIEIKGVHVLLEAMRLLPDLPVTLDVFGNPKKFPRYVKKLHQIAGRDPRIRFRGEYHPSQASQIYQQVDVLVVPSVWYENSPNVILEAYAHRTPVIASNQGALPELVVNEKNGLLFEMGDAKSLAAIIRRLVSDPAQLSNLTAGIEPVKTQEQEIFELIDIYEHNLAGARTTTLPSLDGNR